MALESKVGAFNTGTATAGNTVSESGLGFSPKVVVFWWAGRTESTDAIGRIDIQRGVGWADGTTSRVAVGNLHNDAVDTTAGGRRMVDDACIITCTATGADDGALDLQSLDADGFTLVVDTQFSTDLRVHYLALGGSDLNSVSSGFTTETDTGATTTPTTGVGFQPNLVFLAGDHSGNTTLPHSSSEARLMFGWAAGTALGDQAVLSSRLNDGVDPTDNLGYADDSRAHALARTAGTSIMTGHISSFDADGFTLTWDDTGTDTTDQAFIWLALDITNVAAGKMLTATDGSNIVESGLGFEPSSVMMISQAAAESTLDTVDQEGKWMIGAASSPTDRGAQMSYQADGQTGADLEASAAVEHDAMYVAPTTGHAIDALMDLVSMDSGGFTAVMDDPDSTQNFVAYLALGPAPSGGGGGTSEVRTTYVNDIA